MHLLTIHRLWLLALCAAATPFTLAQRALGPSRAGAAAATAARASVAPLPAPLVVPTDVQSLQPVEWALLDSSGRLASPWIPLAPASGVAGDGALCASILAFDGAEIDPDTATLIGAASCVPGASPAARRLLDVGSDGSRANDCIPVWSQGFQTASGSENVHAESAVIAFYWRVTGSTCISNGGTPDIGADDVVSRSAEPCVITIQTGEGYGNCALGATSPAGGEPTYPGIAFRLPNNADTNGDGDTGDLFDGLASAVVDCRGGLRFYTAVINLCGLPGLLMPADGVGYYTISLRTLDPADPTGLTLRRASCAAPLVWGPDEPNGENRPGAVNEIAWLDLNNDGQASGIGNECSNLVGSCPQALSAAVSILHNPDPDRDTWPDTLDNCPAAPNIDQANADGDSAGDACDGCPNDPHKLAPGQCGCGVVEDLSDEDEDGVPNCLDRCPGEDDLRDHNGDNIPDCLQGCEIYVRGDTNGDGQVDNFDIDTFVEALVSPETYIAREGALAHRCRGDIDGDGDVTNFDIQPFIDCLLELPPGGCNSD